MSPPPTAWSPRDIDRALSGDREAMSALVSRLRAVIQVEVAFAMMQASASQGRDARQELRDLVQDVFVELLARDGKVLRSWDPQRGSSLESFVRLVARRYVASVVRSKRRNPYSEAPMPGESIDLHRSRAPELEPRVDARDRLDRLLERLEQRLDERGLRLFHMLYVEELEVEEICAITGMTRDAVYAWRSRLKRILVSLVELPGDEPRVGIMRLANNGSEEP